MIKSMAIFHPQPGSPTGSHPDSSHSEGHAAREAREAREIERERTYPFLITVDLLMHWALCLGILVVASSLVWIITLNTSPQLPQHFWRFLMALRG